MMKDSAKSQLTWQDCVSALVRRRWFLLGPLFAIGLCGFLLAKMWPVRYRSQGLIMIENQQVSSQYVTPNVVTSAEDRLQSMTDQILSRSRLQHLIEQFDLYPEVPGGLAAGDAIDALRKDIKVEPVQASARSGELTEFRISYLASTAETAQHVVNQLTSLFIDENERSRNEQSAGTTNFLANQLEEARQQLADAEQKLNGYKMQYLGELPEQEQSNLQILNGLQAQFSAESAELDRVEQDKTYLESMRAEYQSLGPAVSTASGSSQPESLPQLRARLAELQTRYTDRYPEIIQLRSEIARVEKLQQQKEKTEGANSSNSPSQDSAADNAQPNLIEINSRLKAVDADLQNRRSQIDSLRQRIQTLQSHLNLTPVRGEQLAEVTRNYQDAKERYESLLQKESQSELATNLEKRQQGDQFRIIDPATLPVRPAEPNRAEIILGSWFMGLLAGLGLVAVMEATDTRLQGMTDLEAATSLPVLVSVPLLQSPLDLADLRRHHLVEALTAASLAVVSLGLGAFLFLVN